VKRHDEVDERARRIALEVRLKEEEDALVESPPLSDKVDSGKTRLDKDRISFNCLSLLQRVLAALSLDEPSADVRALPRGEAEWRRYSDRYLGLQGNANFRRDYADFKRRVAQIQEKINNLPENLEVCSDYRKEIQNLICETLKHPIYRELKDEELNPLVHFLHTASDIIHNRSEGMSVFETLGRKLLPKAKSGDDAEYSFATLGQAFDDAREASSPSSIEGLGRLGHLVQHPKRFVNTVISEREIFDEFYNAYEVGNYNAHLGHYFVDGMAIQSSAGPNPSHSDYTIFPAVLQRNENVAKLLGVEPGTGPAAHCQVILEGAEDKSGAKARREAVIAQEQGRSQFSAVALPLDGNAWKGKKRFQKIRSAEEFSAGIRSSTNFRQVSKIHAKDSGFRISENFLSDGQIEQADREFQAAFSCLEGTERWNHLAGKNELSKTLLLGYDGVLCLNGMRGMARRVLPEHRGLTIDGLPIRPTLNLACKQGIDRGAILNMLLRMIVDARRKGRHVITEKEMLQYCGYLAGRARTVESRKIQLDRYEALRNFVSLIVAASPDKQRGFLDALGLPHDIQFVPSHE
jgi:hypothetical protein